MSKIITVWANYNAPIDEDLLNKSQQLNNICPSCGSMTLYVHKGTLGDVIACASKGCDAPLSVLIERGYKQMVAYRKSKGIEL